MGPHSQQTKNGWILNLALIYMLCRLAKQLLPARITLAHPAFPLSHIMPKRKLAAASDVEKPAGAKKSPGCGSMLLLTICGTAVN